MKPTSTSTGSAVRRSGVSTARYWPATGRSGGWNDCANSGKPSPIRIPNIPWFTDLPWNGNDQARYWTNRMSAFATMFHGVPGFFTPRPFPPLSSAAERPDLVSYYDSAPLKATLARLVDFDLINEKPIRFSVAATNVRTGAPCTSTI